MTRKMILLLLISVFLSGCSILPAVGPELDTYIRTRMEAMRANALQAAIVKNGAVVWQGAYGMADVENSVSNTTDTWFMIGSVSKMLAATMAMRLVETGQMQLDADINTYLPVSIRSPFYPDKPITLRMLLNHTSTIIDNSEIVVSSNAFQADPATSLSNFLMDYLLPSGSQYRLSNSWYSGAQPGSVEIYCNVAYTLIAWLVESVSGQSYDEAVRIQLLTPLGLNGGFFLSNAVSNILAVPYLLDGTRLPQNNFSFWPAGSFRTSAGQLAKFVSIYANNGVVNSTRYLSNTTIDTMLTQGSTGAFGLGWHVSPFTIDGKNIWMHGGKYIGFRALAGFDRESGVGVVILCNGDLMIPYEYYEIFKTLYKTGMEMGI